MWGTSFPSRTRRLPRTAPGGRGPRAAAHAQRRGADLQRLPPSPGRDPARAAARCNPARPRAATSCARCTAGPTAAATRAPAGTLLGAPHFAAGSLPEPEQLPAAGMERAAVRETQRQRDVAGRPGRHGPARRPRLHRHGARPRRDARVQLQLEDLHRGLPRGLPRRPVPPGPGQLRHLRRPALGVQGRNYSVQTVGVANRLGKAGSPVYERWQNAAAAIPRRQAAQVRRDLAHLLPAHHGRVVSARAHRVHAAPDRAAEDA